MRVIIAGDGNEVFYGHMVEHGYKGQPAPQPFLVPAVESAREYLEAQLRKEMQLLERTGH